jgi:AcrR family transcriptional regulator
MLIGERGYEKITTQDIANEVSVNIELVYKYFPDGKFDILKRIGHQFTDEMLMIKQPKMLILVIFQAT